MSAIGPTLPPHLLAKRKRQEEEKTKDEPPQASGAKPTSSPDSGEKRRKVIGPAMPSAPLEERPNRSGSDSKEDDDSDSDDDFGPALPGSIPTNFTTPGPNNNRFSRTPPTETETKPQRDTWMTLPPTQDNLAARLDPTKPRPRGFNTGKSAKSGGSTTTKGNESSSSAWNETPEQKRKRLQDEMMGIVNLGTATDAAEQQKAVAARKKREEDLDADARAQIAQAHGPSLMSRHENAHTAHSATGTKTNDLDDDPSKRSFDREKDMGTGLRIDSTQRKKLLNQASSGFSSKFAGGSYL
ncbi:hypothetical protein LTR62_004249 [Meristemomyces frigidus]|uniref:DUF3752 domain-containing protein n=1 Tax=Meristemomyces frigidus TaxID=1508187 RepID=A0AAN7TID8_9PEZI|nr:hypothetical protein LTR62_004249 [Meristemomyces frigidus]